jgi:hypothetical protein
MFAATGSAAPDPSTGAPDEAVVRA